MSTSTKTSDEQKIDTGAPQYVTVEVRVRLEALAFPEPEGGYSVIVPSLPGCVTQGDTIEEVQANIVEASEGWLKVAHERNRVEAIALVVE
jgi:predicted RNase H-like HicB family nuclease